MKLGVQKSSLGVLYKSPDPPKNGVKDLIMLAARVVDRKDTEFFNTRFNGECSFPVSVYGFYDEKVVIDYNYCSPIVNIETKQIERISAHPGQFVELGPIEYPIHLCRSGFDYAD